MSTRHGRRPGRLARRAVIGAVAAWFATVGGVAGVSWLAIQSAGYAVTGSRLIGISLDAPPAVASRPTVAATDRPVSGSASATRSATTKSGHPTPSTSVTPSGSASAAGAGGRSTTVPSTGQTSRNGGRGGGSSTGAPPAGGQNPPAAGQGTAVPATTTSGGHSGGQVPSSPSSSTRTAPPSSTTSSSPPGSGVTSQSTPGGFVVAECSGDVVHWSVEPASGWSTLQSEKIEHGVKTGFRRSDRVVAVTITCDGGTPTIVVRTSTSD